MENRTTSSTSDPANCIEEVPTSFYRSTTEYVNSIDLPLRSTGKSAAIATLRENREREKRELCQLNDRFASYIERVRFLERDNKKLQLAIDQLREKWGSKTHAIRDKYDAEVHDVRQLIDETAKDRSTAELRAKRADDETLRIKEKCELLLVARDSDQAKIQLLEQQLRTNQSDLNLFHRRLVDLEDEQKRTHDESEQMNTQLQRITRDLDHETIARVELENCKQTLEDEIHFMKKIHAEEIEELKQMNIIGTSLDPTRFFQNELINAVQQIREEYEQLNDQQRTELQTWYQMKVTQAMGEIQSRRAIEKSETVREQEEIKKLRTTTVDLQQDMMAMRRRNGELENRVHELEELIQIERRNNTHTNDERDQQIRDLTYHLNDLERDYDELVATKSSLDSEISIYRKLLESEEKRENLKSIVEHVRIDSSQTGGSTSYPRSRQRTNDSQELGEQSLSDAISDTGRGRSSKSDHDTYNTNEHMPSTVHKESIHLEDSNESSDRSTDYDSSIEDPNERLNRFLAFRFEDRHSTVTSYTASRSLLSTPTEPTIFDQVYGSRPRRPTSIGLNTRWVPITNYSSTYTWHPSDIQSRRTKIRTCFDTAPRREQQKSNTVTPPSSDYTDAYLSAFAPKFSSTRRIYRVAAPVFANVAPVRTFLPSDDLIKTSSTRFNHTNTISTSNSFKKTIPTLPTSSSLYSASLTPETPAKYQPVSSSLTHLPTAETHPPIRPTSFQYNQSSKTTTHLSSPSSSSTIPSIDESTSFTRKVEKSFPSPSSQSSTISPTLSPTKIIYKPAVVFQAAPASFSKNISQFAADERSIESLFNPQKPLDRPETLIFQSDEDTVSSSTKKPSPLITPSPDSPNVHVEDKTKPELPSLPEEQTTASASSKPIEIMEQTLNKYDTIIDQISSILASVSPLSSTLSSMSPGKSALDYEVTSDGSPILTRAHKKPDSPPPPETTTIVTTMTTRAKGKFLIRDDSYDKLLATMADLDNELTPPPEHENTATVVEEKTEVSITPVLSEPTEDKKKSLSPSDDTKSNVDTPISSPVGLVRHTSSAETSDETSSSKKNNKRVTWGDVTVNSEDEESSLSQSFTDEISSAEASFVLAKQGRLTIDQSTAIIQQDIDMPRSVLNVDVNTLTESTIVTASMDLSPPMVERRVALSSSPDTSSSVSDSIDRQTTSSDFNGSRSSQDEHIISSTGSDEPHFILPISYSPKTSSLALPVPIGTDQTPLVENPSGTDNTNRAVSVMVSLRQTIATPATPLIETIQNVVSTMRTMAALKPVQSEAEIKLTTTMVTDTTENNAEQEVSAEGNVTDRTSRETEMTVENIDNATAGSVHETTNPTRVTTDLTVGSGSTDDNMNLWSEKIEEHTTNESESISTDSLSLGEVQILETTVTTAETMQDVVSADQLSMPARTFENNVDDLTEPPIDDISSILRPRSFDTDEEYLGSNTDVINIQSSSPELATLPPLENANITHKKSMLSENTTSAPLVAPVSMENNTVDREKERILISNDDVSSEEPVPIDTVPNTSDILISISAEFKPLSNVTTDRLTSIAEPDRRFTLEQTIRQLLCSSQEQSPVPDEESASRLPQVDDEIPQSTMSHQSSDAILPMDDTMAIDDTDKKTISASSTMTEFTLSSDTSDITAAANQDNKLDRQNVSELADRITETSASQSSQHLYQIDYEIASSDSGLTQSTITKVDESIQTETPNTSNHTSDLSPPNTEPNSSELIDALRGHSILHDHSSEKSPTTTTSSQVTSSDRYVSYAIHQMGDSSQERLPSFPIAADIPVYKYIDGEPPPKPPVSSTRLKEDDSTEFDATDNYTSHSDEILLQRLQIAAMKRQRNFDASSTDEDVDEELEQHDLTNLEEIIDKLAQPASTFSINEEPYQHYELATTPSSNESSSSMKQPPEDIYYIPGYSGLWRPSEDDDREDMAVNYDADDERKVTPKLRRITRTANTKRQYPSIVNQSKSSIQSESRPLDEGLPDPSESDSYKTCASSLAKPVEKQSEETERASSDENLFLIHQRERGVSLPIIMKIDCDDMALRLSTSSPIDTHLYLTSQLHSSSSTHSEPPMPLGPVSDNPTSSFSLSSHESDQMAHPSWLNTINTVTTTTEGTAGPTESQIILDKSAKGPINISECHPQGNYIIIKNTSRSKVIDLTSWTIHQENENGDQCMFAFPDHCLLKPNHSLKILSKTSQSEQRNDDLIAHSLSSWQTGLHILTILINPEGKDCATLTKKTLFS